LARVVRAGRRAPADAVADPAARTLDTGHGLLRVEIVQRNDMWRFVARGVARSGRTIPFHENLTIGIFRPDGSRQAFTFSEQDDILIAEPPVLPPHDFVAELLVGHADHEHAFEVPFGAATVEPQGDAHERAHAADLARRLAEGRPLTRWQIVLFGLSGGLLPCPAAVTVLLLCLQLRQVGLGLLLVGSFSLGLAFTMIASGVVASVGVRRLGGRSGVFAAWARPATYASCALILAIGLYMLAEGIDALA
jgi:nickel/cobalt exporter